VARKHLHKFLKYFVITQDELFLEPYQSAVGAIREEVDRLALVVEQSSKTLGAALAASAAASFSVEHSQLCCAVLALPALQAVDLAHWQPALPAELRRLKVFRDARVVATTAAAERLRALAARRHAGEGAERSEAVRVAPQAMILLESL
jgi:hypothetical protein